MLTVVKSDGAELSRNVSSLDPYWGPVKNPVSTLIDIVWTALGRAGAPPD
jgi:hypothetical protein